MILLWTAAVALGGFLSVAAGAVAAHLAAGDARAADLLRTGALHGMVHATALIAVAAKAEPRDRPGLLLAIAGWGFSVSLFALALTGAAGFGSVTPLGGASLLIGWAALGLQGLRRRWRRPGHGE
jgi:uncharacterized membrane protein YgdD (TMEM256/DUF423 family)